MSDLISRSEVIDFLLTENQRCITSTGYELTMNMIVSLIENQPTAYDIDKVVEELDNTSHWTESSFDEDGYSNDDSEEVVYLNKAIEIVKQGNISDDVCEWQSIRDGEFIQNPHTRRTFSNEPSMQNVYCNTCGKKIKIVGD